DRLPAQIGRADRVRLGDERSAPVLVATDRQREPEREDQADEPQQCRLEDADRLLQPVRALPEEAANQPAEQRRADDDAEDDERERPARHREEHGAMVTAGSAIAQPARRSASTAIAASERRTARSHWRATRPPHQRPAAQKSV